MITLSNRPPDPACTSMWRSRWAAIGAAVAVSLGAGGMLVAQAAPGPTESTIVTVTPERIMDTRDPVNVGLAGPFLSPVSQKLQVTGSVGTTTGTKTVVPAGATGVLLNVTAVAPTANGFISVRPGDATGAPTTSSLNVNAGDNLPNSVQVALPTAGANAGQIDITFDAYGTAGRTTDILVDVVGYMTNTGLKELVADVALKANTADVNASLALKANTADVNASLATKANAANVGAGFVVNTGSDILSDILYFTGADQIVASLNLPAGSYVVSAALVANNNSGVVNNIGCELRLNTTVIDGLFDGGVFPLAATNMGGERESIALTGAGTLAAAGTANIVCRAGTASGNFLARTITAMQVSSLTVGVATTLESTGPVQTSE